MYRNSSVSSPTKADRIPPCKTGPCDALRLDVALAHLGQLHDGDDAGQRGVLHQRDDLIGHRRHNALHHLQQGDLKEDLPAGEAQYLSRLPLSGRHALDAAIIDLLMAGAMIGEGTSYPDLTYTDRLTEEEYGIGCRKGSDLAQYINMSWLRPMPTAP